MAAERAVGASRSPRQEIRWCFGVIPVIRTVMITVSHGRPFAAGFTSIISLCLVG